MEGVEPRFKTITPWPLPAWNNLPLLPLHPFFFYQWQEEEITHIHTHTRMHAFYGLFFVVVLFVTVVLLRQVLLCF